ncbi:SCP-like extracellular [Desulfocurvibacter africanus subsp. africanus str. Walvis Bay]|uniref:SCP-like extracellular n=2 Tax=Desulfocurvibacter africanus TaxID=873 RepID=F3YV81_DESAF|nr:SCP-like extracellular [Desulfocurvibacter africanus subsp. africanus str. Walvis Bay]
MPKWTGWAEWTRWPRLASSTSAYALKPCVRLLCLALILLMAALVWSAFPAIQATAATPPGSQAPVNLKAVADAVHKRINQIRAEHGLKTLTHTKELAAIALSHSQDMARRNYFSHNSPEGRTPSDRADKYGYDCRVPVGGNRYQGIGENIFQITAYKNIRRTMRGGQQVSEEYTWFTPEEMAEKIVTGWMNSPPHRAIILNRHFSRDGLGLAYAPDTKTVYITHNFC